MESYGTLTVYAFTSNSRIPIEGAAVTVLESLEPGAKIIATAKTDRSGYIAPIRIAAPIFSQGLTPNNGIPFSTVGIRITHPNYEEEDISGVQIFPNTVTVQSFRMIPIVTQYQNESQIFETPPQNL